MTYQEGLANFQKSLHLLDQGPFEFLRRFKEESEAVRHMILISALANTQKALRQLGEYAVDSL